jgi:flagellar biosynthesis protein FliQ
MSDRMAFVAVFFLGVFVCGGVLSFVAAMKALKNGRLVFLPQILAALACAGATVYTFWAAW